MACPSWGNDSAFYSPYGGDSETLLVAIDALGFTADFDGDLDVDGADYLILQRGLGLAGQTDNSNGDADGSGTVDGLDLAEWEAQFGTVISASTVSAVPEPMTSSLLALALVTTMMAYRKRVS